MMSKFYRVPNVMGIPVGKVNMYAMICPGTELLLVFVITKSRILK